MNKLQKIPVIVAIHIVWLVCATSSVSTAQCAMCKANVESNMKDKTNDVGQGLNKGILYLMSIPYLAGGALLYGWYRKRKQ